MESSETITLTRRQLEQLLCEDPLVKRRFDDAQDVSRFMSRVSGLSDVQTKQISEVCHGLIRSSF